MKQFAFAITAILVSSLAIGKEIQKKDVDIRAQDGTNLKASYYSPGQSGPAILLLHQCNMDRHAWDGLAADLASAGFHVLTVDYRGYGESGGEPYKDASQRRTAMQDKWPGDVDAAYSYLKARKGVDQSRVLAGGASCGVAQSSDLAARHHEIRALVLLSGSASDMAKEYIASSAGLAVFGAGSEEDAGAAKGIKEAVGASRNPHSTLKMYAGKEHGVPMFEKNSDLEPALVSWAKAQATEHQGTR